MNIPLFDGHCDALYKLMATPDQHLTDSDGQWSLHRCQRFAPQAQVFAVFADSAQPDVREQAARQIQRMHQECALAPDRIALCTTGTQAEHAVAAGKLAAFLSVEGAELLDCSLEKLRWAHGQGVRIVHPTWNHANVLSGSHCDQPERGLSQRGRRFVSEMVRLGMLVDVSHLSEAGYWDVVELVQGRSWPATPIVKVPFSLEKLDRQTIYCHNEVSWRSRTQRLRPIPRRRPGDHGGPASASGTLPRPGRHGERGAGRGLGRMR